MILLRYAGHSGEIVDVVPETIDPLSYTDLVVDYRNPNKLYPLRIHARSVEGNKIERPMPGTVSMPLTFRQPVRMFLVGRWRLVTSTLCNATALSCRQKYRRRTNQKATTGFESRFHR